MNIDKIVKNPTVLRLISKINELISGVDALPEKVADDTKVVHLTGNETINGIKRFNGEFCCHNRSSTDASDYAIMATQGGVSLTKSTWITDDMLDVEFLSEKNLEKKHTLHVDPNVMTYGNYFTVHDNMIFGGGCILQKEQATLLDGKYCLQPKRFSIGDLNISFQENQYNFGDALEYVQDQGLTIKTVDTTSKWVNLYLEIGDKSLSGDLRLINNPGNVYDGLIIEALRNNKEIPLKCPGIIPDDSNDITLASTAWTNKKLDNYASSTAAVGLVHTTGDETIAGAKKFTGEVTASVINLDKGQITSSSDFTTIDPYFKYGSGSVINAPTALNGGAYVSGNIYYTGNLYGNGPAYVKSILKIEESSSKGFVQINPNWFFMSTGDSSNEIQMAPGRIAVGQSQLFNNGLYINANGFTYSFGKDSCVLMGGLLALSENKQLIFGYDIASKTSAVEFNKTGGPIASFGAGYLVIPEDKSKISLCNDIHTFNNYYIGLFSNTHNIKSDQINLFNNDLHIQSNMLVWTTANLIFKDKEFSFGSQTSNDTFGFHVYGDHGNGSGIYMASEYEQTVLQLDTPKSQLLLKTSIDYDGTKKPIVQLGGYDKVNNEKALVYLDTILTDDLNNNAIVTAKWVNNKLSNLPSNAFTGATASTVGTKGLVPAPSAGDQDKFLKADGTWAIINLTDKASTTYVDTKVASIVNSAPETLDTLNELATALGNDPNFATTISKQVGLKANAADLKTIATTGSYNDLTDVPIFEEITNAQIDTLMAQW